MTMSLIETKTLGTAAASIEFTSIPQDGTDLLLLASLRTASGADLGNVGLNMTINGVSTNRTARRLYGNAGSAGSDSGTGAGIRGVLPTSTSTSNTFGNLSIYFPNYSGSTNKSFSLDSGAENNSSTVYEFDMTALLWSSTDAITSLLVSVGDASNLSVGSTISLYKITKGSSGGVTVS